MFGSLRFVETTTHYHVATRSFCQDNDILKSWPRGAMLRERLPFLMAMSLMHKQTCVSIATWDYYELR